MLFVYMCVPVYRVLYSCKHLKVSDMEGIVKNPQPRKFPRWKTLSHSPQEWFSLAAGGEVCPEQGPATALEMLTMVRDWRIKSGSEFHALLTDKFNTLGCCTRIYVKSQGKT